MNADRVYIICIYLRLFACICGQKMRWKVRIKPRLLVGLRFALLCCCSLIILTQVNTPAVSLAPLPNTWPPPQVHPLPPTLANWQDATNSGDYFDRIKPAKFWSFAMVEVPDSGVCGASQ